MSDEIDGASRPESGGPGRPTRVRYLVLVALATAAVDSYLTRVSISPAGSTIQRDLGFDDREMGYILSGFFLGYLAFQVPGGWLGDRIGARRGLTLLCLLWSACTLAASFAHGSALLWWSRIAMGAAQGGLFPITAKVIIHWFPPDRRGIASAVPTGFMSVGSVAANGLTVLLIPEIGWRGTFQAYAAAGLVWALAFYLWFRNRPEEHPATNQAERKLILGDGPAAGAAVGARDGRGPDPSAAETFAALAVMATSPSMWALCSQSFCRAFGYAFFITWFPSFLERSYHVHFTSAGLLTMMPMVGVVVGSLVGGWLVDAILTRTGSKWLSRSGVAAVALTLCALATLAAGSVREPLAAVTVIAIGSLFSGLGGPTTWAATMDIGGDHTSVVFGIMNMAGNLGGIACPILVGHLFKAIGESGGDWNLVLYLIAAVFLAGAFSWLLLDPNRSAVERPSPAA